MSYSVSIIINCYNGEKYLEECLKSLQNQIFQDFEVIFWDNCSGDKSAEIFKKYESKKFRYFKSKKFLKLYEARNQACKQARGVHIAFLDTDDLWHENFLSMRSEFFKQNDYKFSYSNCFHLYEISSKKEIFTNQKLKSGNIFNFLSKNYLVKISCLIIKKDILEKENFFHSNYNIIGDFDLVMRIASRYKAHSIQNPVATIRFHSNNYLDKNRKMFFKEFYDWFLRKKNVHFSFSSYFYFLRFLLKLFIISLLPKKILEKVKKK